MKLWDLGGQSRFRESWEKYCRDSDVIIFVLDSQDKCNIEWSILANIDVARASLHELLSN
jgi:GTPase SAR1 family protein